MKLRRLNDTGISEFESFMQNLRSGIELNVPDYLLQQDQFSELIELDIDVSQDRVFTSRYELGSYLVEILPLESIQRYMGDSGFWTWFALLWFEQLCPRQNGKYAPSKAYNYVLSKKYTHRPRHAIYISWQLVQRYGEDARFMLCNEPSKRGEITEQLMARQEMLSSDATIRLASFLYFDPQTGRYRKGAASRKSAGCIARYISWIQQLELTFDIFSTTREELEELLPREFDRFRNMEVAS